MVGRPIGKARSLKLGMEYERLVKVGENEEGGGRNGDAEVPSLISSTLVCIRKAIAFTKRSEGGL